MTDAKFEFNGLGTAIGSMPHVDPHEACSLIFTYLPELPFWPQLPKKTFVENMYFQFRPSFLPKLREETDETIYVDMDLSHDVTREISDSLEQLYSDELENRFERYGLREDRRAGFDTFLSYLRKKNRKPLAVKGQVTGPISWGLKVADENQRPVLYNDTVADAIARHLKLSATWQENALRSITPNTIIAIDEPYLSSLGSAFVSLPREQVVTLLEETLGGIEGLKAIHCCGNTDWSVVLQTSIDILSFDAYNYGDTIALYPSELKSFLDRGGVIAWGIVPNDGQTLAGETETSLLSRLEDTMGLLTKKGIRQDVLLSQCLITPSCGLESLSIEAAAKALELTSMVSATFRKEYCGHN